MSKHPLRTGHTRCEVIVEIRYTGLPVVKASMEMNEKSCMLHDLFHTLCYTVVSILAFTRGYPEYLILTKADGRCDRSAEDTYSSAAPDPTFAFVEDLFCFKLDFVFAFLGYDYGLTQCYIRFFVQCIVTHIQLSFSM
jgi:hypothetical protein